MGCNEEGSCQPWARWGQQLSPSASTQCHREPPCFLLSTATASLTFQGSDTSKTGCPRRAEPAFTIACLIFLFPEPAPSWSHLFLQSPNTGYKSLVTGNLETCPFLLCLTYLSLPLVSHGGFCSSRAFALESWAFVLLTVSRCLEVILACTGYFGTEAAFYVLL